MLFCPSVKVSLQTCATEFTATAWMCDRIIWDPDPFTWNIHDPRRNVATSAASLHNAIVPRYQVPDRVSGHETAKWMPAPFSYTG